MKKIAIEIFASAILVFVPTYFVYQKLAPVKIFWNSQALWSMALIFCWVIVAIGYYHQGWLVRKAQNAKNVSLVLPIAVFFVQCILFVKGIYYHDQSLVIGAIVVNSGVFFSVYNIFRSRHS